MVKILLRGTKSLFLALGEGDERVWEWLLSIDMKTKVVQHVQSEWMRECTFCKFASFAGSQLLSFRHFFRGRLQAAVLQYIFNNSPLNPKEGRGDSLLAIFATCYMRYKYSEWPMRYSDWFAACYMRYNEHLACSVLSLTDTLHIHIKKTDRWIRQIERKKRQ